LHPDEPVGIFGQRVQKTAQGQDRKSGQKNRLAPPDVGSCPHDHCHRNHDGLGRDNTDCHQAGAELLVYQGKLLPDQRQHGCIRKMEDGCACRKDEERPR